MCLSQLARAPAVVPCVCACAAVARGSAACHAQTPLRAAYSTAALALLRRNTTLASKPCLFWPWKKADALISCTHLPFRAHCLPWEISCGKQMPRVSVTPCLHTTACATRRAVLVQSPVVPFIYGETLAPASILHSSSCS